MRSVPPRAPLGRPGPLRAAPSRPTSSARDDACDSERAVSACGSSAPPADARRRARPILLTTAFALLASSGLSASVYVRRSRAAAAGGGTSRAGLDARASPSSAAAAASAAARLRARRAGGDSGSAASSRAAGERVTAEAAAGAEDAVAWSSESFTTTVNLLDFEIVREFIADELDITEYEVYSLSDSVKHDWVPSLIEVRGAPRRACFGMVAAAAAAAAVGRSGWSAVVVVAAVVRRVGPSCSAAARRATRPTTRHRAGPLSRSTTTRVAPLAVIPVAHCGPPPVRSRCLRGTLEPAEPAPPVAPLRRALCSLFLNVVRCGRRWPCSRRADHGVPVGDAAADRQAGRGRVCRVRHADAQQERGVSERSRSHRGSRHGGRIGELGLGYRVLEGRRVWSHCPVLVSRAWRGDEVHAVHRAPFASRRAALGLVRPPSTRGTSPRRAASSHSPSLAASCGQRVGSAPPPPRPPPPRRQLLDRVRHARRREASVPARGQSHVRLGQALGLELAARL